MQRTGVIFISIDDNELHGQKFSLYEDLKVWENIRLLPVYGIPSGDCPQDRIISPPPRAGKGTGYTGEKPSAGLEAEAGLLRLHLPPSQIVFLDEPTGGVDPATRAASSGS